MPDQRRDILFAIAQRGHLDGDHVEAEEQILAKGAALDGRLQILVGGGDDPRFEANPLVAAQGPDLMLLERAQQPRLQFDGQLADFIQEDRARAGRRQQPLPRLGGPGESAFDVPEQLAFNQGGRQRPAINRDKGLIAPGALGVDGPRHQFLARAAFAHDQNRVPLQRHFGNQPVDFLHPLRIPDQAREL